MGHYHFVRPNWETRIPRLHVCVATVARPRKGAGDMLELAAWAMSVGEWTSKGWRRVFEDCGHYAQVFWPVLHAGLRKGIETWVWLLQPRLDLPLLDFAKTVEDGRFQRTYWVWADPPVIVRGSYAGLPLRMVGLSNWLPDAVGEGRTAWERVRLMQQVVARLLATVEANDLGHLRSTVGGQAYQSYRHLHLPDTVPRDGLAGADLRRDRKKRPTKALLNHGHSDALRLERSAAIGWPPDLRRRGEVNEPISVLDCNGLYPYVMAHYPYPRKLLWYTEHATPADLTAASASALLIARVKVSDFSRSYLITENGKCRLVRGDFSGTLVGPDLDSALSRGKVLHCWEAAGYEGAGLFVQWAPWVWGLRQTAKQQGDAAGAHVAKMLSVALWGQFAQRLQRYVATDKIPAPAPYGEFFWHKPGALTATSCRAIAGQVDELESREEPKDSVPSISAFVACYARGYMAGLRAIAGEDNVVYQVADALHVTAAGRERLEAHGMVQADVMGKLKVVREVTRSTYIAANTIVQDGELTAAGIYGKAECISPGVFRWRLPRRLSETVVVAPLGTVEAPLVERSIREAPSLA